MLWRVKPAGFAAVNGSFQPQGTAGMLYFGPFDREVQPASNT